MNKFVVDIPTLKYAREVWRQSRMEHLQAAHKVKAPLHQKSYGYAQPCEDMELFFMQIQIL